MEVVPVSSNLMSDIVCYGTALVARSEAGRVSTLGQGERLAEGARQIAGGTADRRILERLLRSAARHRGGCIRAFSQIHLPFRIQIE